MPYQQKNPSLLVATTRQAFIQGYTKPIKYRQTQLKNFIKFLEENEEPIVHVMHQDMRKPHEETRLELVLAINHIKSLLNDLKKWIIPERPPKRWIDFFDGVYVHHDPYGIVLVMGAWNFPLLTIVPAAGAIAAGNCVVIKPSHQSPAFSQMLAEVLPRYLDPDCNPVVLGDIKETNRLLEEKFDYIYYTGSTAVGKIVHLAANKHLTPTTLEMGGKNPVYIDDSANLKMAATRVMWGKCFNSGQICIAPDYILCTKSVQAEFVKHAATALKQFNGEAGKRYPIINDHHFRRLQRLLDGLTIAIGGHIDPHEHHIEPTIAIDVNPNHLVMQEEIFGPILPIVIVANLEEAVTFINRREKALALYIFTENSRVRDYIIDNTSCGGVTVNDTMMHFLVESLPFGGVGSSGMGCYKGKASFDTFVHKKSVLVKNSWRVLERVNEVRYPPYLKVKTDIMGFLIKHRKGISLERFSNLILFLLGLILGLAIFYFYVKFNQ